MKVQAILKAGSHIEQEWRERNARGGTLCGVLFSLAHGVYVASDFSPGAVDNLLNTHCVTIEFFTGHAPTL
jgi:hypothetical protein